MIVGGQLEFVVVQVECCFCDPVGIAPYQGSEKWILFLQVAFQAFKSGYYIARCVRLLPGTSNRVTAPP